LNTGKSNRLCPGLDLRSATVSPGSDSEGGRRTPGGAAQPPITERRPRRPQSVFKRMQSTKRITIVLIMFRLSSAFIPAVRSRDIVKIANAISMNLRRERRSENVEGNLYVDNSCIDCDTCRYMAPIIYKRVGHQSAVVFQPQNNAEKQSAYEALISCPTGSIRIEKRDPYVREVVKNSFPIPIDPEIPDVYHLGYHDKSTYAAAPYLIVRMEGNIMIDVPRYSSSLASQIANMGGIQYIVLTHKDDIGDHERWKQRFPHSVLHLTSSTSRVEIYRFRIVSVDANLPEAGRICRFASYMSWRWIRKHAGSSGSFAER
jgi:ferredoxin